MLTMKFNRSDAEKLDLSEWGLGDSRLDKAITEELQDRLDVVFSEKGADVIADVHLSDSTDELVVSFDLCFSEFEAHATGWATLRELFLYNGEELEDEQRIAIAKYLRNLADEFAPNAKLTGRASEACEGPR